MGKIAFVFSGQGDQYPGMGLELYEQVPAAAKVLDALEALRPGTLDQCFRSDAETLKQTNITQPCLFAMESAAAAALCECGIRPDAVAGFSLGEIAALTFSGAVSLEDGFRLVCKRGELMQRDASKADTGMAAVVKLSDEQVIELCAGFDHVYPVNFNCPGQVSVAGLKDELKDFMPAVKAAGGRAIPLKVAGAFHSPFMSEAAEDFLPVLKDTAFNTPSVALYSNFTGAIYEGDFADLLSKQICNPVRWVSIIRAMIADGVDTFIEMGPGKTLCGLIGKIDPSVKTFNVKDCESLRVAAGCVE